MLRSTTDWTSPDPDSLPTGSELIRDYLAPLSDLPAIKQRTRYATTVTAISREGMDRTRSVGRAERPFVLRVDDGSGSAEFAARAVIDASGTYSNPNRLSSNGLDPLGWDDVKDAVTHALPDVLGRDRGRFARRRTLVVGAGHSAANTLIALSRLAVIRTGNDDHLGDPQFERRSGQQFGRRSTRRAGDPRQRGRLARRIRDDRQSRQLRDRFAESRRRRGRRQRPSTRRPRGTSRRCRRECDGVPARPGDAPRGAARARRGRRGAEAARAR